MRFIIALWRLELKLALFARSAIANKFLIAHATLEWEDHRIGFQWARFGPDVIWDVSAIFVFYRYWQ